MNLEFPEKRETTSLLKSNKKGESKFEFFSTNFTIQIFIGFFNLMTFTDEGP